jgi:NAD+ synthase
MNWENTINWEKEIENICLWLKNYLQTSGAKGYIVGISGGLDSAIVASLCVRAVGKENVFGVMLPCNSRLSSLIDAQQLAKNLGIDNNVVNLQNTFGTLYNQISYIGNILSSLAKGNIKARLRMATLYALGETKGYLVVGTGNLSEISIGYFSKHGDGGTDLLPIANYYKTELYEMVKFMPEIPVNIINKKPSADLWEGQTDEEEMGITYKDLDYLLSSINNEWLLYDNKPTKDISDKITKIKNMIKKSEHKRKMAPQYMRDKL